MLNLYRCIKKQPLSAKIIRLKAYRNCFFSTCVNLVVFLYTPKIYTASSRVLVNNLFQHFMTYIISLFVVKVAQFLPRFFYVVIFITKHMFGCV